MYAFYTENFRFIKILFLTWQILCMFCNNKSFWNLSAIAKSVILWASSLDCNPFLFLVQIACVSPSQINEQETLNTLRYANRAQNIENIPIMKSDSRENVVQKLKRELRKLKEENMNLKQKLNYPNQSSGRLPKIAVTVPVGRNGSSNSIASSEADLYGMLQDYIQENKNLK